MAKLEIVNASRTFAGNLNAAVDSLTLSIADGELIVLVGPSGCGKSTTLRMIAGLEPTDGGKIFIGSQDVTNFAPRDRDIAMIFQSYALYPHLTVEKNIAFSLKMSKVPKDKRKVLVEEVAKMLELTDYLDRKPAKLSGGQRQRVAMGRAIIRNPSVFLMDEPLSNLDAKLRNEVRAQIVALQKRLGVTTIYVTHDQVEAMTMGDRVVVMKDGVLQQVATPTELYELPVNTFVAGFIGTPPMNLIESNLEYCKDADGGSLNIPFLGRSWSIDHQVCKQLSSSKIVIGVRPEEIRLIKSGGSKAVVQFIENLGYDSLLHCRLIPSESHNDRPISSNDQNVIVRCPSDPTIARGSSVNLEVLRGIKAHLFDRNSGNRVGNMEATQFEK